MIRRLVTVLLLVLLAGGLQRLAEDVADLGSVESTPRQDGRNMTMVLGPHAKKTQARSQQRRERDAREEQRKNDAATSA